MFSRSTLVESKIVERKLPANLASDDISLFSHEASKINPTIYLNRVNRIYASDNGLIQVGKDKLFSPLYSRQFASKNTKTKIKYTLLLFKALFWNNKELEEEAMWVVDCFSANYFHWITDVLPRLQLIQRSTSCKTLLLPTHLISSDFVQSSLHLFGIQKLIEVKKHQVFKCKNLLVIDTKLGTGNYDEESIRDIRNLCISAYSTCTKDEIHEKIYISRSKAIQRRILNEHEIIPILDKHGFHLVYMEDHSFEEQMKLTMSAKYIISNHGAGMTNMVFMQTGGSILELRRAGDSRNNCYFSLASALSLKYYYQLCCPESREKIEDSTNILVDTELFKKNIQLMLAES